MKMKHETFFLNVSRVFISSSFTAAIMVLARYKLDLLGVQEVRWDKRHSKGRDYNFL